MVYRSDRSTGGLSLHPVVAPKPRETGFGRFYRRYVKRALDTALVLASAPVSLPLIAVAAGMVALDGGKPFYSQTRLGKDGRHFRIWKLRSMVVDADARLNDHLASDPEAQAQWARTQKLKSDPRVTRIGRVLRKTSLDELPQLFNVLNGTMSLVGPRPMMVEQRDLYHGSAYYELRPGITGLWQVSERNEAEFVARVRYDPTFPKWGVV